MELRECGRVKLFCGTIIYSLTELKDGYTIKVHNIDTGEICCVCGLNISAYFAGTLMKKLTAGSVTPITAYDVIRDSLCDFDSQIRYNCEEIRK